MSLLLQALKKAEEDKRRRAELANAEAEERTAEVALDFPALNLVEDEQAKKEPEPESIAESQHQPDASVQDWDFVPLETTPDTTPQASDACQETLPSEQQEHQIELLAPLELATQEAVSEVIEPVLSAQVVEPPASLQPETHQKIVAPIDAPASLQATPAAPEPSNTPPTTADPTPTIAPKTPAQPQMVAKSLFGKPKTPAARGLLPWILLGAGLLLAGMMSWFVWQYRQLTQPTSSVGLTAPVQQAASAVAEATKPVDEEPIETASVGEAASEVPVEVATTAAIPPKPEVEKTPAPVKSVVKPVLSSHDSLATAKFVRQAAPLNRADPVMQAWQAYQLGQLDQAEQLYRKVLQSDPRQRDALLGLAAIAQQRGALDVAAGLYQRVLKINPQDESAKAGLLMLNSTQLPEQEAVQLEQSGKSDPTVLGQHFASQQRWAQAQEQFFLAYTANPNSADTALNLAVSLDHLKQSHLAKTYYLKALQSAGPHYFDRNAVEQRLAELDANVGGKP